MAKQQKCSSCEKTKEELPDLFAIGRDGMHLCSPCIQAIAAEAGTANNVDANAQASEGVQLKTPSHLVAFMDQYVIGQSGAKRSLAVAVYNHYKRINNDSGVELEKSNVLMLGPTGCGKTLLARTLARTLNVPIAIADATSLTQAGYVGDDCETILQRLIQAADGDVARAQNGIIFLDEVDKIARSSSGASVTRDVSGEGVQQALLKIIEGSLCNVPITGNRKQPGVQADRIDTSNILFICAGAFVDLDPIISKRLTKNEAGMGFVSKVRSADSKPVALPKPTPDDLSAYGLIPEFIGRVPVVVRLEKLSVSDLAHVMTEPKNAIVRQLVEIFRMDGVALTFTPEAVRSVAEVAHKQNTGARGIRTILEDALSDVMFSLPDSDATSFVVDEAFLIERGVMEAQKAAA